MSPISYQQTTKVLCYMITFEAHLLQQYHYVLPFNAVGTGKPLSTGA
jgi:hypothetical protein